MAKMIKWLFLKIDKMIDCICYDCSCLPGCKGCGRKWIRNIIDKLWIKLYNFPEKNTNKK